MITDIVLYLSEFCLHVVCMYSHVHSLDCFSILDALLHALFRHFELLRQSFSSSLPPVF